MKYSLWIVTPHNYIHSRCFEEVALSLSDAIKELGHECSIVINPENIKDRIIILGANLLPYIPTIFLQNPIIFNLEQISVGSPWLSREYLEILRSFEVWDYSRENIRTLEGMGIKASLCEIGYMPSLTTIEKKEHDIDILHVGSITERRMEIINKLSESAKVHFAFGVYGKERDDLISRSKIVLNIHFYESKVFEIVRCSHLMANKKCIVSETGAGGEEYREGIYFADYSDIVASCLGLLGDDDARSRLEEKGFELFSNRSQVEFLRGIL